jgi:hypothetical protein
MLHFDKEIALLCGCSSHTVHQWEFKQHGGLRYMSGPVHNVQVRFTVAVKGFVGIFEERNLSVCIYYSKYKSQFHATYSPLLLSSMNSQVSLSQR